MPSVTRSVEARAKRSPFVLLAFATALAIWTKFLVNSESSYSVHSDRNIDFPRDDTRVFVAIVSCITSKTDRLKYRSDQLLRENLLPSLHTTISDEERTKYRVEFILGYDEGDVYWQHRSNQEVLVANGDGTQQPIPVSFISLPKDRARPNRIPFNELCQAAYNRGVTYLVRINDDTHFVTPGWLTHAIHTLQSFSPPNIGVVGPNCKDDASGEREILTHDMTYLPFHLAIFGTYYPSVFDNYYIDDWISRVYGENRTKRLDGWEVVHNIKAFGTRYTPSFSQNQYLDEEVERGKEKVQNFIATKEYHQQNAATLTTKPLNN